jgi:WD40 repeat protein
MPHLALHVRPVGSSQVPASVAAARGALLACLTLISGCGQNGGVSAPADAPHTAVAAGSTPSAASTSANSQAVTGVGAAAPAVAAAPPIAQPTADQIARWTPAPFEPLDLLAVREWKKTSFTGSIAATPDGKHFLVAGSRVLLWSLAGDEPEHVFLELTAEDGDRDILALAVAPNGKWFAVGDSNGMVRVWSIEDRKELFAKELDDNAVTCIAISPDSKELATIAYESEVAIWNAETLAPLKAFDADTNSIERLEYLAAGQLAVAGETNALWDTAAGTKLRELSPGRYTRALARTADGSRFLYGADESLTIWDVAGAKIDAELKKRVSGSELVAFSPDGKTLATSDGRGVQLWNLAERRVAQVIDGAGSVIVGLAWLPETNLLAVASDSGRTRIWGTAEAAAAAELKPLHAPLALPAVDSKEPALPSQMAQVIDLRTFPTIPGSEPSILSVGDYSAEVAVPAAEAMTFYNYFLTKAGWTATPQAPPNPAIEFRKDGFLITASFYDAGAGKTHVSVHHEGNYDVRWAPKFDAAPTEPVYEMAGTLSYRTKASLLDIETSLLRKMQAAGWTPYSRLHTSFGDEPDSRDVEFVRNGQTLRVSIGRFPVDPDSYTISYTSFPVEYAAPIPPDAGYVEFDGSTESQLLAITKLSIDEAAKFYEDAFTKQGWLVRSKGKSDKGDQAWLACLRDQCDLVVGFSKLDDGRTLVRIGDTGGSIWEASLPPEEGEDEAAPAGLEAADFPVPGGGASYDKLGETIEVVVEGSTLADAAKQFTDALAALGWKPDEGGIRDEEYTMIDFTKGEAEFTLRARKQDGNAVVSFNGDGLLWTKELPGGKQPVSYETWLRLNKRPPGLEGLEQFEAEMRSLSSATPSEGASP